MVPGLSDLASLPAMVQRNRGGGVTNPSPSSFSHSTSLTPGPNGNEELVKIETENKLEELHYAGIRTQYSPYAVLIVWSEVSSYLRIVSNHYNIFTSEGVQTAETGFRPSEEQWLNY